MRPMTDIKAALSNVQKLTLLVTHPSVSPYSVYAFESRRSVIKL
jgi:hypothetical protein